MRSSIVSLFLILGSAFILLPKSSQAAYTLWYGVFQHPEPAFQNVSALTDGIYERQDNP